MGPFTIDEIKEHSFVIKNILTGSLHDVHGSRLKRFSGNLLGVTDELRQHVANQGLVLGVRSINDLRFNRLAGAWELQVSWVGLEDEESSWEQLSSMQSDVPVLVQKFLDNIYKNQKFRSTAQSKNRTRVSRRYVASLEGGVLRIAPSVTSPVV